MTQAPPPLACVQDEVVRDLPRQAAGALFSLLILTGLIMGIARHAGAMTCTGPSITEVTLPATPPAA